MTRCANRARALDGVLARWCSALALALASLAILASPAAASDGLFVDRDSVGGACSDTRTAAEVSSTTPWCSLGRAVAAAPSGATVSVRRGSYPQLVVSASRGRTAMLTLRARAGESVAVAGASITDTTWLRLEGFRFTDRIRISGASRNVALAGSEVTLPGTGNGVEIRGSSAGDAEQILLEGNRIHGMREDPADGMSGYGIRAPGSVDDITIRGNEIYDIGVDAIQVAGVENLVVEGNEIYNVRKAPGSSAHADPLQVLNPDGTSARIRANYIHDNSHSVLIHDGQLGLVVENNVIVRTDNYAMKIGDAPNARIVNNTLWDNLYGGLVLTEDSVNPLDFAGVVLANNILQSLGAGGVEFTVEDHNVIASGTRRGAHDTAQAPTFTGAYELAAGSVGIDAGLGGSHTATDRLGRARVDDPAAVNSGRGTPDHVDMGALERAGTASEPTATEPEPIPTPTPEPTPAPTPAPAPLAAVQVLTGASPQRDAPTLLEGRTVSGDVYVFTSTDEVDDVRFYVDDPQRTGTPYRTESNAPYDLAGGDAADLARPFDTRTLADGSHAITVAALRTDGTTTVTTATFTVANAVAPPPATDPASIPLNHSTASNRSGATPLLGKTIKGSAYVFATDEPGVVDVRFYIDDPQRTRSPYRVEENAPWDMAGGSVKSAKAYDTRKLGNGSHTVTAAYRLSSGTTKVVTATFTVAN